MNEEGWIVSLQQPDFSEIFVSGFDAGRDHVFISHNRDDASIFENMKEAADFLDLIRPNLLETRPACKFFVDEL